MIWLLSCLDIQIQDANQLNSNNLHNNFGFEFGYSILSSCLLKRFHTSVPLSGHLFCIFYLFVHREIKPRSHFVSEQIEKKKKKNNKFGKKQKN